METWCALIAQGVSATHLSHPFPTRVSKALTSAHLHPEKGRIYKAEPLDLNYFKHL